MPDKASGVALRLVFCGTPEFAVPSLEALLQAGHEVALVLTQPDRPRGRGMQTGFSAVKQCALAHGLPVEQPETLRNNEGLQARLQALAPDAIAVVAYGRILPLWMLALPRLGCVNLHGSLLPQYRGAAPIQWAVAKGETVTGVTTMLLEQGLDTGPMLERVSMEIGSEATSANLFQELAVLGAPLLVSTLAALVAGTLQPEPQNAELATHAPMLTREDGRIDFSLGAADIYNRWRGFQPWPGAWTLLDGKKLTIVRMALAGSLPRGGAVGELIVEASRLYACCGSGTCIELLQVQLEGRRPVSAAEFARGLKKPGGAQLG